MKRIAVFLIFSMLFLLVSCSVEIENTKTYQTAETMTEKEDKEEIKEKEDKEEKSLKAIWLSQFDLYDVYQKGGKQRDIEDFSLLIDDVIKNVKSMGFNAVILQVRPYSDSIYPSNYYPPSRIALGKYGNEFSYDPLKIIIQKAHDNSIELHAWINPLRAMTETEIGLIPDSFQIKQWYNEKSSMIKSVSNRLYIDPAYDSVRELIISGVKEIVSNYDVDGIHMDDYFYPTTDVYFDMEAFSTVKNEMDLSDFRRDNISKLVKGIYSAIKEIRDIPFGISPAGNLNSVYSKDMADVYLWCSQKGYIDYITPQVYFGLKHQTWDFVSTCKRWNDIIKTDDVKLYIGMTIGKAISKTDQYAGSGKNEWATDKEILKRCLVSTKNIKNCAGVFVFSYQYFFDAASNTVNQNATEEKNAFLKELKITEWN